MKFIRSKEWWLRLIDREPDVPISAGVPDAVPHITRERQLERALTDLVMHARTSGGTAGRDEGLCASCDRAEAILQAI